MANNATASPMGSGSRGKAQPDFITEKLKTHDLKRENFNLRLEKYLLEHQLKEKHRKDIAFSFAITISFGMIFAPLSELAFNNLTVLKYCFAYGLLLTMFLWWKSIR